MRWETKTWVYSIEWIPTWWWWPEYCLDGDVQFVTWLCWCWERISKEWLDFCEDHGGGFENAIRFLEREMTDEAPKV